MSAAIAAGTAPADVTVRGPGWEAPGIIVARAPYSVRVAYASPEGEACDWFVWQPDRAGHGKLHGVHPEFAPRIA